MQAVADSTDIGHNTGSRLRVLWCTHSHPQEDTAVIADRMLNFEIRHVPVTRDGTVLGMVSMRDLLAFETWTS